MFEMLPTEMILLLVNKYLTPNERLSMRCLSSRLRDIVDAYISLRLDATALTTADNALLGTFERNLNVKSVELSGPFSQIPTDLRMFWNLKTLSLVVRTNTPTSKIVVSLKLPSNNVKISVSVKAHFTDTFWHESSDSRTFFNEPLAYHTYENTREYSLPRMPLIGTETSGFCFVSMTILTIPRMLSEGRLLRLMVFPNAIGSAELVIAPRKVSIHRKVLEFQCSKRWDTSVYREMQPRFPRPPRTVAYSSGNISEFLLAALDKMKVVKYASEPLTCLKICMDKPLSENLTTANVEDENNLFSIIRNSNAETIILKYLISDVSLLSLLMRIPRTTIGQASGPRSFNLILLQNIKIPYKSIYMRTSSLILDNMIDVFPAIPRATHIENLSLAFEPCTPEFDSSKSDDYALFLLDFLILVYELGLNLGTLHLNTTWWINSGRPFHHLQTLWGSHTHRDYFSPIMYVEILGSRQTLLSCKEELKSIVYLFSPPRIIVIYHCDGILSAEDARSLNDNPFPERRIDFVLTLTTNVATELVDILSVKLLEENLLRADRTFHFTNVTDLRKLAKKYPSRIVRVLRSEEVETSIRSYVTIDLQHCSHTDHSESIMSFDH